MSDLLDERTYRSYIAYEALHKKPVEKTYKRMKRVMPNVDYFDFQYWYFRFLNGKLDLDHDRSKDPKTPLFSDIPIEVVDIIVGKLDAASKLSVRKVSKTLRSIVDSQKTKCESVSLSFCSTFSRLRIEMSSITYHSEMDTSSRYQPVNVYDSSDDDENERKWKLRKWAKMKTVIEENHLEMALNDFSSFFLNPSWKFKKLTIDFGSDQRYKIKESELIRVLIPLLSKFPIHVENLTVRSATLLPMVTFPPYFKGGVLEALGIWSDEMDTDLLGKIMGTDDWKNAERLQLKKIPDWFDIQLLFHARRFTVENCRIDEERLVKIRDILLNSKTFEKCTLKWGEQLDDNELFNLAEIVDRVLRAPPAYDTFMEEYLSETTGRSYEITADLCSYSVELNIIHVERSRWDMS